MPSSTTAPRRTQEERSNETRQKILDATLSCLIEVGYAGTSTPLVCRRAGMSRGALLHHFPTKTMLVTSAMAHLAQMRAAELREAAKRMPRPTDGLDGVFALMWEAFSGPLYHAALELWVAARCDADLHAALLPVERSTGKGLYRIWRLLPEPAWPRHPAARKQLEDLLSLTLHLLRGMALQKLLKEDEDERKRLFEVWRGIADRELSRIRRLDSGRATP